jgi:hypothetical protein
MAKACRTTDVITVTSTSSTLATLGVTIREDVAWVMLRVQDSAPTVYYNIGAAASASTSEVGDILRLPTDADVLATYQFYAASNATVFVEQG